VDGDNWLVCGIGSYWNDTNTVSIKLEAWHELAISQFFLPETG
jgi:hypothetical protein